MTSAPNPPPQAPPGISALAETITAWLKWGVLTAGVIGLLARAGMIFLGGRRHGGLAQEGLIGSLWVLGGLTLASVAAVLAGTFARLGAR